MRVVIPEFDTKNKLFAHLKTNKKKLLARKCSTPIKTEVFDYGCLSLKAKDISIIGKAVTKNVAKADDLSPNEIQVDAIANMAGWCDSYMDVLIPDNWDETIKEKGASNQQLIYHLKNHNYSTDAIIGGDVKMRSEWLDLSIFNIESDLTQGQALIGNSIVKQSYDKKCFHLYTDDEIKQHSIGLRYIRIYMCIDSSDEDYVIEKENWDKYYKYVINKDKVDDRGYFWAVTEIKLLEYSAVLFGANELTPTLEEELKEEPPVGTPKHIEPSEDTQKQQQKFYKNL